MVEHGRATDVAVGLNVARLRQAQGLSQTELAEVTGVAQQTIQKIEKGTRPLKFVEAVELAKALRVSIKSFSDRPEAAIAESHVIHLNHELAQSQRAINDSIAALATVMVNAALEISANRARPERHRAPAWRIATLKKSLDNVGEWTNRLHSTVSLAVRNAASTCYELPLPKGMTAPELIDHIANTAVRFSEKDLESMDLRAGDAEA